MNAALVPIFRPPAARLLRHPKLRDELVSIAVKLYYAKVPAAFRVSRKIEDCPE